jgi:transcriptional regulator with PAS, ATPase and Fis domain
MTNSEIQNLKQKFGIIGNAQQLNYAIEVAAQVAPTEMSVLITGESGSGKESFSKIIHSLSHRKHGQFIAINCGAIPEGTIDSELFGHEKGSFTGAHEARKGYFEVTSGGTIFLDEIGEMPLSTQARLLRVLENGEFIKVGSSKVQRTDVRVIAATNANLLEAVETKKFREDLYYRLNTVPIFVPPLRARGEDIVLLFRKFTTDFSDRYKVKPISLDDSAKKTLMEYRFPGNIRQLKNLAEQISVLEIDREINATKLNKYLPQASNTLPALLRSNEANSSQYSERDLLYKVLFDMKNDVVELKKLVHSLLNGNQSGGEILKEHESLFKNMSASKETKEGVSLKPFLLEQHDEDDVGYEKIEDITHEPHYEDSLSIEHKEKELIIKALHKNKNKRKYAANDLGISERTLYRKIKQYGIDEL